MGAASGYIQNAINKENISGLQLLVRRGINNIYTKVEYTECTSSTGKYTLNNIPAGNYTIEVKDENNEYWF